MRKLRSDSKWQTLPPQQREMVLKWLFDDGLSFKQALNRARKELGINASATSLRRFYHHWSEERHIANLALAGGNVDKFRQAALKILGVATLELALNERDSDGLKRLVPLVKLLLKERDQALTSRRIEFNREKFERPKPRAKSAKKGPTT